MATLGTAVGTINLPKVNAASGITPVGLGGATRLGPLAGRCVTTANATASRTLPRPNPRRRQVFVCAASSQLSQAELEELLAENAKLKQLLNTYANRLSKQQVDRLTKQYEEIAALAAAAGLELEPLDFTGETTSSSSGVGSSANGGSTSSSNGLSSKAAPATAAGAPAPKAVTADVPAKPAALKPKAVQYTEGDKKVKAWVIEKGGVVQFSFDDSIDDSEAAHSTPASQHAAAGGPQAAGPAAVPDQQQPASSAVSAVDQFIQATKQKASGGGASRWAAMGGDTTSSSSNVKDSSGAAPGASSSSGGGRHSWRSTPMGTDDDSQLPAAAAAPQGPPAPVPAPPVRPSATSPTSQASAVPQQQQQQRRGPGTPLLHQQGQPSSSSGNGVVLDGAAAAMARLNAANAAAAAAAATSQRQAPPPKPQASPKPVEDDILDIPDPLETAAAAVKTITAADKAKREAENKKVREVAQEEVDKHDPTAVAATRHQWLIFTVPEKPVAGCDVVVYYNRTQSEPLRERNRIQLCLGFNQWELAAEQARVDLYPSAIPHMDGSDFWSCRFRVPETAYEVNFVLTDGDGLFDNNLGQDYTYPTQAGSTWEEWTAAAVERAAEAEKERQKKEEARRAEEAKQMAEEKEKRDSDNALKRVAELRDGYKWLQEGGLTKKKVSDTDPTSKTLWSVAPTPLTPGKTATLLYNSKAGPLAWIEDKRPATKKGSTDIVEGQQVPMLHYGYNNWKVKCDPLPMKLSRVTGDDDELWWEVSFNVPKDACCVNFVVNSGSSWDNNGSKDHKIAVELPKPYDAETVGKWAESMLEDYLKEEHAARIKAEKEQAEREAKRLKERTAAKEKARAVLSRQMEHVMFTEPEVIQAGERVTVYYNPDGTVLAGTSEVYFTGGFNRWAHKRQLGPVKMRPPGPNGRHWRVRFSVPKDACQLDFVFSNVPGGDGIYDNRGGFDYHLPIKGSIGGSLPNRLHVAHIAVEMAPVAKVGGLGDVVTALARAVQEEGHLVEVILPRYDFFLQSPVLAGQMRHDCEFDWGGTRIFVSTAIVEGLRCFFIEPRNGFFATPTVYGRYDDEVRFDFFCKAALEFLLKTGRQPDILHCHDWSTAHVAKSFWEDYQPYGLWKPKVIFTIHNLNYGQKKITEAAQYCQKFTTVSPTYAFEVGGHPAIASNNFKFMGIRNGIDTELWSPTENKFLPMSYDANNVEEGKRRAREELRKRVNLSQWQDKLIIAVVSRLTPQKGVHLIKHAAYKALDRGCQFVLLGSAPDPKLQTEFNELADQLRHGQDASFIFEYNEPLSYMIYAAADIVLVPSMFEPCGLTQMIAMRYGAVPVVRHTGGLRDTVFDVDNDKPRAAWEVAGSSDWMRDKIDETNGFAFEGSDEGGLDYALNRAIDAYYNDRAWFRSLQARVMRQDWSWNRPALDYIELYYSAVKA